MRKFQRGFTIVELFITFVVLGGGCGVLYVIGHFVSKVW